VHRVVRVQRTIFVNVINCVVCHRRLVEQVYSDAATCSRDTTCRHVVKKVSYYQSVSRQYSEMFYFYPRMDWREGRKKKARKEEGPLMSEMR